MTTTTATALTLLLALALPAAARQQTIIAGVGTVSADVNQDQFVTDKEAAAHDEQRFGEITGGGEEMTEEQFTGAMTGAQDAAAMFSEVDADGSGRISRDEWTRWRQRRFTAATRWRSSRRTVAGCGALAPRPGQHHITGATRPCGRI